MKEAYEQARDKLVGQFLDHNPDATEEQAEAAIEHRIMDEATEMMANRADRLLDEWKDRQL